MHDHCVLTETLFERSPCRQIKTYMCCRQAALEVTKAVATHIQSKDALQSEVSKAQKILDGSAEGRIKNASERAALAAFIAALCPPHNDNVPDVAEQTASFLSTFYKYGTHLH